MRTSKTKRHDTLTPTILRRRAERLIAAGEMPPLDKLLEVVAGVRERYAKRIREAKAQETE